MADIGQSVLQRLKSKAQNSGKSYQLVLQLFCQEEILRRVQNSRFCKNLVLKGGLFLFSLSRFESRPTMDVDFMLRNLSNQPEEVVSMIKEILSINTGNDFVNFEIKGVESIAEQREYNGIRIKVIGILKNTRTPFDVDFGVGDVVIPHPEERRIPVQLDGFKEPEVLTYSLESTIAEKWDAIISLMELSSRMKDYYDIYYLACTYHFEARKLQEAIFKTIQNRGTIYESNSLQKVAGFP
jgi:predicted nucleotidyltransferase component of viral defense system